MHNALQQSNTYKQILLCISSNNTKLYVWNEENEKKQRNIGGASQEHKQKEHDNKLRENLFIPYDL
jgi:hypothetical protein